MKAVKINKANWTDQKSTIELYDDGKTVNIPECNVQARIANPYIYDALSINTLMIQYSVEINDSGEWRDTGWKAESDLIDGKLRYHIVSTWDGHIKRTSEDDIRYAIAKLIFNVY